MKLTPREIYNIIEAIKARIEWVRDTDDDTGLDSEVPIMEELFDKLSSIYIDIDIKEESKNG